MSNYGEKIDLLKLKNACRVTIPGKTARKRGIFIPFEDNSELFDGEKGVYLNLTVVEMKQPGQYGDTHIVKGNKSEDEYKAMSDEERKALPILGQMRPLERKTVQQPAPQVQVEQTEDDDDLPF